MARIVAIVEGHGEVESVPLLIRRLAAVISPDHVPDVAKPIRIGRQKLLKAGELERSVELAARQSGDGGGILIVLDADDDCPKELAEQVLDRARAVRSDRRIKVVLAKREYESWFLAAAESVAGQRGLSSMLRGPAEPENLRDAKGWLTKEMPKGRSYRPTLDQAALTARFDLGMARDRSPSAERQLFLPTGVNYSSPSRRSSLADRQPELTPPHLIA